jgi:CRP-like cAMP-binding protein
MHNESWNSAEWSRHSANAAIHDWRRVLPFGYPELYQAGTRFIDERLASRTVFLIHSGIVKLSCATLSDIEIALMLRFPGDLVGQSGGVLGLPQFASATAVTDCLIAEIATRHVLDILKHSAEAASSLAKRQIIDSVRITSLLIEARTLRAEQRLFRLLAQLAVATGAAEQLVHGQVAFKLPLSESDLADLIGVKPKSFSRLKRTLIRTGRLQQNGSRFSLNSLTSMDGRAAGNSGATSDQAASVRSVLQDESPVPRSV